MGSVIGTGTGPTSGGATGAGGTSGSIGSSAEPACAHRSWKLLLQSAMQFAATCAVHAVRSFTVARRAQPTVTCTLHVASHDARHLSSHVDALVAWQSESHLSEHCDLQ
jgi:hypothetical protein